MYKCGIQSFDHCVIVQCLSQQPPPSVVHPTHFPSRGPVTAPSVTPSEGSSTSEGPGGILTTVLMSPNTSLVAMITGQNYVSSRSDSDGFSKSEDQSETQNPITAAPDTSRLVV